MTDYPVWAFSASELRDLETKLPGETWHAITDPDEEDAAVGEAREFDGTLYGGRGECD